MNSLEIARSLLKEAKEDLNQVKGIHVYICDKIKKLRKYRCSLNKRVKELKLNYLTNKHE